MGSGGLTSPPVEAVNQAPCAPVLGSFAAPLVPEILPTCRRLVFPIGREPLGGAEPCNRKHKAQGLCWELGYFLVNPAVSWAADLAPCSSMNFSLQIKIIPGLWFLF